MQGKHLPLNLAANLHAVNGSSWWWWRQRDALYGAMRCSEGMWHPLFLFPCGSAGKESASNAGDLGLIPGLRRFPGEGKGYPLQYSSLENYMDYSPWGCRESTRLTYFHKFSFTFTYHEFSSVQSLSRVRLFATPWITARQACMSITNSRSSLKLMSIESMMPSNHLILCNPAVSLSQLQGLFQWVSSLHQVAKVLEFQLQHQFFQWIFKTDFL